MGRESRRNEAAKAIGKFHVHLRVTYVDGSYEEGDYRSWAHVGQFIACDKYEGGIRVYSLEHAKYFEVENLDDTPESLIEKPN